MNHQEQVASSINALGLDADLQNASISWIRDSARHNYSYNFNWMGRPIIQLPEDMIRMQEVFHQVRPTLVVETGVAHGGSLIFYASLLKAMDIPGRIVGIDVEVREENRRAREAHCPPALQNVAPV